MTGLVDWATSRARMILAFIVLSVTAGIAAYSSLPKEGAPNIDVPILYVSVPLAGAAASDIERLVVKPLEAELRDLEGLDQMTAYATESHGGVLLKFDFGWDKAATVAEVRDRVDRAQGEMPDDADEPRVIEVNLSEFPILVVSLSGDAPERTLLRLAKDLQREIESLPSVLEATLAGHRDEMVEVLVDPLKLEAYDITAAEVVQLVTNNNRLVAAGALDTGTGKFSVSVPGSFETARDVFDLPVKVKGDRIVRLGEIANIRRTFKDRDGEARYLGDPTVALQVKKRTGENIIETVATTRAKVAEVIAGWPAPLRQAVTVDFSLDQSTRVQSMVSQLENSVLTAILLVMIVVVATLGARSALLVGLAVPSSFLLAFALFAALGMGVNNMVMFGLILAVGMLVDGAIVVAELADRRLSEGASPRAAYREAAKRMFWPIISSTATTLCAFLPMLFWPGMPGQFMGQLPVTLIFVLSASLLVALIYLPVLGAIFGQIAASVGRAFSWARGRPLPPPPSDKPHKDTAEIRSLFGRIVAWLIGHPIGPVVAILVAVGVMAGSVALFMANNKGVEFFVKTEPEAAVLYVRARGNLSLEQQDALVRVVEQRVMHIDGVGAVFAFSGKGGLQQQGGEGPNDAVGQIQIELTPWEDRLLRFEPRFGDAVIEDIKTATANIPGAFAELSVKKQGPQQGKPVQLLLASNDRDVLEEAVKLSRSRFEATDGLVDVDDTRPLPGIEWRLSVDRAAAGRFGADVAQIGAMVQMVTRGVTLDTVTPDDSDDEIDIIMRYPEAERTLETLDDLKIRTPMGLVPLSNFVTRDATHKVGEISRRDGVRFYLVRADVAPGVNANAKIAEIGEWLTGLASERPDLAQRLKAEFTGDQEEQEESQAFLGQAFLGALGLMFVILLAQFNSVYNSILVLSAVVMSVAGVLLGMVIMGQPFSIIMTGTGIVALAGIVVNNNIVLIDTYQEYERWMPRLQAIAKTAEDRLRPVMLTTITTIAGLLPMMFATSIDFFARSISIGAPTALWWVQLATAVVFGLGFSTVLTLVVTPSALALRVWIALGIRRLFGLKGDRDEPVAEALAPASGARPIDIAAE